MPNPPTTGLPNPSNYVVDPPNDTVTDTVTGLMWQRTTPSDAYTWDGAKAYCAALTHATFCDWRLPSRIELVSIVDLTQVHPSIDPTAFPNTPIDFFWTSSQAAVNPAWAWYVDFDIGETKNKTTANTSRRVRCVR